MKFQFETLLQVHKNKENFLKKELGDILAHKQAQQNRSDNINSSMEKNIQTVNAELDITNTELRRTRTRNKILAKKIEHQKLKFDFIIALPMHRSKEKTRGFNQTKIIENGVIKLKGPAKTDYEKEKYYKELIKKYLFSCMVTVDHFNKLLEKEKYDTDHSLWLKFSLTTSTILILIYFIFPSQLIEVISRINII